MKRFKLISILIIIGFLMSVCTSWGQIKGLVSTAASTSINAGQVTVDTTAGGILIKAFNPSRRSIIIRNQGGTDAYVGPNGLTTATGLLIKAGESVSFDRNTAAIWGIVAAGSTTMSYLEE